MTGARVTFEMDDATLQAALDRTIKEIENPQAMLDEIGARLELSVARRFETEMEPGGQAWIPSLRATEEGGQTLTDSARLRQSISRAVSDVEVAVGTNVIYAAIHQFGGKIEQPERTQTLLIDDDTGGFVSTRTSVEARVVDAKIPARTIDVIPRPFLGISDADVTAIHKIVRRHVEGATGQ